MAADVGSNVQWTPRRDEAELHKVGGNGAAVRGVGGSSGATVDGKKSGGGRGVRSADADLERGARGTAT